MKDLEGSKSVNLCYTIYKSDIHSCWFSFSVSCTACVRI